MSSGCGDVLSLADLQTAKKHQLFEAEVITGKQGGIAAGADIDYATNQVTGQTQKTMPAILRDIGFEPASFDFTTGGTLATNDRNKAVLWPMADGGDGDWYYWEGTLPKVIPAASTPASTGGVAEGAWRPVGDITLRGQLATADSGPLVDDSNVKVLRPESGAVQRTQHEKNNEIASVLDYGAVGDGVTDDTAAFNAAASALSAGIYVPKGSYYIPADISGRFFGPGKRLSSVGGVPIPFSNPAQSHGTTFIGFDAGKTFAGDDITAQVVGVGPSACRNVTTGTNVTAVGAGVLTGDTLVDAVTDTSPFTGTEIVAIGVNACKKAVTLSNSIGIGRDALNENKFGNFNIAIGSSALQQLHTGSNNVAVGRAAGMRAGMVTDPSGVRLSYNTVNGCTLIGNAAGREITSGDNNTYVGANAGRGVTSTTNPFTGTSTGSDNVAVGTDSLNAISSGNRNVTLGRAAGRDMATGSGNIFIGYSAAAAVTSGDNQLIIANQSGLGFVTGQMGAPGTTTNYIRFDADVLPATANTRNCGNATRPWAGGATQTAFTITSDANAKTQFTDISDMEKQVAIQAKGLIKKYKYKTAVAEKGAAARYHVGVIAQELVSLFEGKGIDPFELGIVCLSQWEDEDGSHELYSVRYEELLCFIIAAM